MVEIRVARKLMVANDRIADELRAEYESRRMLVVNVMGSPGSGKTSLLEKVASALSGKLKFAVIEGDLETARDAERMERAGVKAVQITTGKACHLDAGMVRDGLAALGPDRFDALFVENVGNLVCPAGFDLGEDLRMLVSSVSEGDDKAAKYVPMFRRADILVLNKTDLLPHVDFDVDRFESEARAIRPEVEVFRASCRTGAGVAELAGRIESLAQAKRPK